MINIAIFASGAGSNFQAIVKAIKKGKIPSAQVKLLVCDKPGAYVLKRAKKAVIKSFLIELKDFKTKDEYEQKILEELRKENIELIVLAGYMKIVGNVLLEAFPNKIINIHPSLCPAFPGMDAEKQALNYGAKFTGCTVHFVTDEGVDTGPIILQDVVKIEPDEIVESLQNKIHQKEDKILAETVKLFSQNKLKISGRKVKILK